VRDLVIGMTLVRADGVVAHSGGKVVKNVAGYDLAKLLTGSFGTLGVITQVALRLHPVPAGRYWVTQPVASAHEAASAVAALVHSQLMPAAIELDWRPAIDVTGGAEGTGELSALLEGHGDGAQACAAEAAALLGRGATITDTAPSWWGLEPDASATAQCKVTHEIGRLRVLLDAAAAMQTEFGIRVALRGSPGVGVAQVALRGEVDQVVGAVEGLRSRSDPFGGTVVVLEAPAGLRQRVDVWGPVAGLDLMRAVKAQFDPGALLAPGRFVGGI
jgi:glycolate oxidase FAD binding subunit